MVGVSIVSSWIQGRAYLKVKLGVFDARQTVELEKKGESKLQPWFGPEHLEGWSHH